MLYRPGRIKTSRGPGNLETQLRQLQPPLLRPSDRLGGARYHGDNRISGLRQRHLRILAAALHRSLLRADYVRARRVWSLLLRTEMDGHSADLRFGHRWGIGAELLLQHGEHQLNNASFDPVSASHPSASHPAASPGEAADANIAAVLAYYDRLRIQYPHNKYLPSATGPLEFVLAKLSLCLSAVASKQTKYQAADAEVIGASPQETLDEARTILGELDRYAASPPFSDHGAFSRLRGMLETWIRDLSDDLETELPVPPTHGEMKDVEGWF